MVRNVVQLLQILQTWISTVSFQISSFKTIPYATRNTENTPLFKRKHHFFSQLLSNGTILTITFEMSKSLLLLKTISWNQSGQPPMFLIVKIIEESNLLQDCLLALVICVNRNSNSFQDTLNPICSWGLDVESTYYILRCPMYNDERHTLLSTIKTSILDC